MTDTGRYLYAISRDITDRDLPSAVGLRGAPLQVVEHRGLSAVVSTVDLDEFGDEALRRNLEDITWLEDVARTHDSVVRVIADLGPTAPLRLATIYLDDGKLRARVDDLYDAMHRTLDRVEGRMEWSVKAFAPWRDSVPATGEPSSSASGRTGTQYLMQRKAESAQRDSAVESAAALADELHRELSRHAAASRRLPPQDRRLTGHEAAMTLNGAYLVERSVAGDFEAAAASLSGQHPQARIDVQGPWPPYSFATLDDS